MHRNSTSDWLTSGAIALVLLFAVVLGILAVRAWQLQQTPVLVDDHYGLLDQREQNYLGQYHSRLLEQFDVDYRIVIIPGQDDIAILTADLFRAMDVGHYSQAGKGLLLVLQPDADKVRLEVGYSLEPIMLDAFVAYIESEQMVPFFQKMRVADGIVATTELIVNRFQNAAVSVDVSSELWVKGSGGAGAQSEAQLGQGASKEDYQNRSFSLVVRNEPQDPVLAYMSAMEHQDTNPTLSFYTAQTQEMLKDWVVTSSQMKNMSHTYKSCGSANIMLNHDHTLGVMRYPVEQRQCSPWFLAREGDVWKLDLTMMQHAIRFNANNQWRVNREAFHHYWFGFSDLNLDRNGYPRKNNRSYTWGLTVVDDRRAKPLAWISRIIPGSRAEAAGLQQGDIITAFNSKVLDNRRAFFTQLDALESGEKFKLSIQRQGQRLELAMVQP
ncbi:TPM domain-containing protein [Parendozoicomonas haliclonae]|uniref:Periplasmic pH-dependent serine endoprotease DegQ n=1 Tax=Parendozoicomonas haliclonae TaxID=1960125 RepID=A0A1X7AG50_9GAMM|nr:TPM domain-containing protein [Parendozoicomonas haliclonae]SMA37992.1 Periplasmic pH-dependent serine endoprotease DegQ precursor [Parendozoicomonas haliclonae]